MLKSTLSKHQKLELLVLKKSDAVVAVTYQMAQEFEAISNRKIQVVTNGFAKDDFEDFTPKKSDKIIVFHHGSLNADRNPLRFWEFLGQLVISHSDWRNRLEIQLIGAVDISVFQELEKNKLTSYLNTKNFMPHNEVIEALSSASLCLLPLNNTPNAKGIMPNKLYEFLITGKPIVLIGPKDGDAARVINNFDNCCVFDFDEAINSDILLSCLSKGEEERDLSKFQRNQLAIRIDEILNSL